VGRLILSEPLMIACLYKLPNHDYAVSFESCMYHWTDNSVCRIWDQWAERRVSDFLLLHTYPWFQCITIIANISLYMYYLRCFNGTRDTSRKLMVSMLNVGMCALKNQAIKPILHLLSIWHPKKWNSPKNKNAKMLV